MQFNQEQYKEEKGERKCRYSEECEHKEEIMQLPKLQYQQNSEGFVNETEETKEDFPRMHQI